MYRVEGSNLRPSQANSAGSRFILADVTERVPPARDGSGTEIRGRVRIESYPFRVAKICFFGRFRHIGNYGSAV
ncbi:hypothetical protein LMG9964_02390 [Paraburkholderia phenoliruptrix]|uniref:Uncharacterized protein n=1 Tax=Paraburkholderia phenoliruptrix TaxID=252970 RepID=A0A6J5K3N6_9BURK|nr:hypothetical protein LMG9964_02390 [Paraburkholderia phenoliruptrix]